MAERQSLLRGLTLQRLVIAITFISIFVIAVRVPLDTDTFWHLRAGEWMVNERRLLRIDIFSSTRAGLPWINHSYLSQLALYGVYAALGDAGLALYVAVLATAGMALIYPLCSGNIFVRAFIIVLAAATAAVFWSPRPQMMSFALSALVYHLLHRYLHEDRDRLWLIPIVMLAWANLHAGFAIGFVLMVLSLMGEVLRLVEALLKREALDWKPARRLVIVGLVSAAAISINPYGPQMLAYPFRTVGIGVLRDFIQEWRPPDFHQPQTWPFIWMLLGLLAIAGLSRRRLDWRDLTLATGTAYLALLASRSISLFAIVAAPIITRHLADWLDERNWKLRALTVPAGGALLVANWAILLLVLLAGVGRFFVTLESSAVQTVRADVLPVGAVEYLQRERPDGSLFNSYNWGGYLIWQARDYPVYLDGRTDLYDDDLLRQYLAIYFATDDDWEDKLDEADINIVLIEPTSPLARVMAERSGWVRAYEDAQAVVYTRMPR